MATINALALFTLFYQIFHYFLRRSQPVWYMRLFFFVSTIEKKWLHFITVLFTYSLLGIFVIRNHISLVFE